MKIGFAVMTEFLKHQEIYTLVNMVKAAQAKGHHVTGIFFFGSGVMNVQKKGHLGKTTINIPQVLAECGAQMYACQTWADNYGIFAEDVIDKVEVTGLGELSNMTAESEKMVFFGAHA